MLKTELKFHVIIYFRKMIQIFFFKPTFPFPCVFPNNIHKNYHQRYERDDKQDEK